jgi:hypothetical protein
LYLVNYLSLQFAEQLFIAARRYRTGQGLLGPKTGLNYTFRVPWGEKFSHNLPFLTPSVYFNGVRQTFIDDYMVLESGGPGTGYDTVVLNIAPLYFDHVTADYVVTA